MILNKKAVFSFFNKFNVSQISPYPKHRPMQHHFSTLLNNSYPIILVSLTLTAVLLALFDGGIRRFISKYEFHRSYFYCSG